MTPPTLDLQAVRDLAVEVCHELIDRAMRNERDADHGYAPSWPPDEDRKKEAAIRQLLAEVERLTRERDEVRVALERDCRATVTAGITQGAGHPLVEHVGRLQSRLHLDHDEKCSVVVRNLMDARADIARLESLLADARSYGAELSERLGANRG